jgi:hypothetical protein
MKWRTLCTRTQSDKGPDLVRMALERVLSIYDQAHGGAGALVFPVGCSVFVYSETTAPLLWAGSRHEKERGD